MVEKNASDRDHWNRRYAERPWPTEPSSWLMTHADQFTSPGRALDIAGGTGRNAIWLAAKGWNVTIADVSNIAIEHAEKRARSVGVSLHTLEVDLAEGNLPLGPWDTIMLFHYLDRALFPKLHSLLCPGGIVIGSLATVRNLENNKRPPLPYLLQEAELPELLAGLELVDYEESWEDGHHDARFVAHKAAKR